MRPTSRGVQLHIFYLPFSLSQNLTSLVNKMGEQVTAECQRQGAWGFLGDGVGATLLCPDTGAVLTKKHFFGNLLHLIRIFKTCF